MEGSSPVSTPVPVSSAKKLVQARLSFQSFRVDKSSEPPRKKQAVECDAKKTDLVNNENQIAEVVLISDEDKSPMKENKAARPALTNCNDVGGKKKRDDLDDSLENCKTAKKLKLDVESKLSAFIKNPNNVPAVASQKKITAEVVTIESDSDSSFKKQDQETVRGEASDCSDVVSLIEEVDDEIDESDTEEKESDSTLDSSSVTEPKSEQSVTVVKIKKKTPKQLEKQNEAAKRREERERIKQACSLIA